MTSTKKQRCYIYTRVSTIMQVDGYSLDAQRERLRREAVNRDMLVVNEYSDEGKSGKNISGRPAFTEMMGRIANGNQDDVDYVLVFKLSRFGRNAADVLQELRIMQQNGVNLLSVEEGIDSYGPVGKLMISVIAAVAEIERENINAQTMEGRIQKAREGKWNGGFAPYGYKLENGSLVIEESEAEVIRLIFDEYANTVSGCGSIAKKLNLRGYKKKIRQNGTVDQFSEHFVRSVIDNPVYMGKIAYGRRKTEKVKGSGDKTHTVKQSDYGIYGGEHEAIVSEEVWTLAHDKRQEFGGRRDKVHSLDHEHQLSGILRCPVCGAAMYGSVNRKRKKDGTYYKDAFYYVCKHRKMIDGRSCSYRRQPSQDRINAEVESVAVAALKSPVFIESMKSRLNMIVDEDAMKSRIEELEKSKAQLVGAKAKLAQQMDRLDITVPHYNEKYDDMQSRLDALYDEIALVDEELKAARGNLVKVFDGRASIANALLMLQCMQLKFSTFSDQRKKSFYQAVIESVEIFPERQPDGRQVKAIHFKFPITVDGETSKDWWYKETHDETVCLLVLRSPVTHINIDVDVDEMVQDKRGLATYGQIKDYVLEQSGLKVSSLYIAQVKQKCGIIERENYNKAKSEDARQPQCPPEKEKAIMEALQHFGMI